jgi:hypothetical protein
MKQLSPLVKGMRLHGDDFAQAITLAHKQLESRSRLYFRITGSRISLGVISWLQPPFSARCRQQGHGYGILSVNRMSPKENLS